MNFFGFIPAKSNSKGLKNKNIKIFNNKPLIYWTIKAANESKKISNFLVSTDSKKIKKIAKRYKANVPFLRPKRLSRFNTPMIEVVKHAYKFYKKFDAVVLLQPTSPLRDYRDIDNACKIFEKSKADSLIAVNQLKHTSNPEQVFILKKNFLKYKSNKKKETIRQKKKIYYSSNGSAIYITKVKYIKKFIVGGKIVPFFMPKIKSIDIDDAEDFKIAELISKKKF